MGTEHGKIRKHLEERLKGTYSEAELDAIAATLDDDPDLLTPVPDHGFPGIPAQTGLHDPTGTVLNLDDLDQIQPHVYAHEVPPVDYFFSQGPPPPYTGPSMSWEFKITPADFEKLAQSLINTGLDLDDLPDILEGKK